MCPHRHSAGLAGSGEKLDEGDGAGRQLIGRGSPLPRAARREALDAVSNHLAAMRPEGWDPGDVASSSISAYHQACVLLALTALGFLPAHTMHCMLCCTGDSC